MASTEEQTPPSWRAVPMLAISETVAWGALYYSFGVLLRPFASYFAVSEAAVAGAFSVALLASAGAAWISGRSIDRWGPRPVMTLGALLGVAALAFLAGVETIAGFYVAWAAIGVSHAFVLYEPAFAAVTKWFSSPAARARALLAVTMVAGFASTLFVPLTATVYAHVGRQRAVLVLAHLVAVTALPLNAALPEQPASTARTGTGPDGRAVVASSRLAPLTLVFALQAFASAGITVHLVSLLRDRGFSLGTAATVAGLMGAAQVPARLAFQPLRRFIGARARLPLLLGLQAVALLAVFVRAPSVATVAVLLVGAANGLITLERAVVIAESFGVERYGDVSGRIATFAQLARAGAPILVGLVSVASSYRVAFVALAGVLATSLVISWAARATDHVSTREALWSKRASTCRRAWCRCERQPPPDGMHDDAVEGRDARRREPCSWRSSR